MLNATLIAQLDPLIAAAREPVLSQVAAVCDRLQTRLAADDLGLERPV